MVSLYPAEFFAKLKNFYIIIYIMSAESWIGIAVGISTIIASVALGVRWLVKHYFEEVMAELKPNSGSSLKDQVTRLEKQHEKLETKIDNIYKVIIEKL
jgi:hypothetical protein